MKTLLVGLLAAVFTAHGARAQDRHSIRTKEAAESVAADTKSVSVDASGPVLTQVLEALAKQAPNLTAVDIYHMANKIELRSVTLLAEFKKLESLKLTGDPFLYDDEFAALGKLATLKSLSMSLP
jgi:hypothetical protein